MGQKEKDHIKSHRRESYRATFLAHSKMKAIAFSINPYNVCLASGDLEDYAIAISWSMAMPVFAYVSAKRPSS